MYVCFIFRQVSASDDIAVPEWELFINDLARVICEEQSPKRLVC